MKLPRITQVAKGLAKFLRYQDGNLWYSVPWIEDDNSASHDFEFPIPVDDAGGGEFLPVDKALTFMRWMRKHLEYLNGALAEGVYDQ